MLLQNDNWRCGPFAIYNACLALGHLHDVDEITDSAGSIREKGTDEKGILAALAVMEYTTFLITKEVAGRVSVLFKQLLTAIDRNQAAVLCVDGVDHWVAVIGKIGAAESERLIIFDSQREPANVMQNGVCICDETTLTKMLRGSRYAILVGEYPDETDSVGGDVSDTITAQLIGTVPPTSARKIMTSGTGGTQQTEYGDHEMPPELADFVLGGRK